MFVLSNELDVTLTFSPLVLAWVSSSASVLELLRRSDDAEGRHCCTAIFMSRSSSGNPRFNTATGARVESVNPEERPGPGPGPDEHPPDYRTQHAVSSSARFNNLTLFLSGSSRALHSFLQLFVEQSFWLFFWTLGDESLCRVRFKCTSVES